jgi:hypothetical protein
MNEHQLHMWEALAETTPGQHIPAHLLTCLVNSLCPSQSLSLDSAFFDHDRQLNNFSLVYGGKLKTRLPCAGYLIEMMDRCALVHWVLTFSDHLPSGRWKSKYIAQQIPKSNEQEEPDRALLVEQNDDLEPLDWPYRPVLRRVPTEDGGGLHIFHPTLGPLIAYGVGDTMLETLSSLQDGIKAFRQYNQKHPVQLPEPTAEDLAWQAEGKRIWDELQ